MVFLRVLLALLLISRLSGESKVEERPVILIALNEAIFRFHGYGSVRARFLFLLSSCIVRELLTRCEGFSLILIAIC